MLPGSPSEYAENKKILHKEVTIYLLAIKTLDKSLVRSFLRVSSR